MVHAGICLYLSIGLLLINTALELQNIISPDQLPYTTMAVYSDIGVYYDANLPKRVIIREVRCVLDH